MPQSASFRVFVSAVTNELASNRDEVARVLRRKELVVQNQEHFRQGGATLIEALRDYIRDCDAVIFLIGDQCGSLAGEEHAAVLGANAWFDRFRQATGLRQASYTPWNRPGRTSRSAG
ncbi:MAG TPA: DUF4062 domain-containing protein [Planctomycetaceae bacterium]|nr:DUF4062 domain-containing protein [Planctomycetaceae bacterium]